MDANERESAPQVSRGSGSATRMKRVLTNKAQHVKESLNDSEETTTVRIDHSREATAKALAWTASSLHSQTDKMSQLAHTQTDKLSQLAHSAADRLQVGAAYLRERDVERIMEDAWTGVKQYPGRSLAAAAIVGFLWARRPGNKAKGSFAGPGKSADISPEMKQEDKLKKNVARLAEESKMKRETDIEQTATDRRGSALGSLLAGMGIGAALSVLLAPRPGVETRRRIAHKCLDQVEAANKKVQSARLRIQDLLDKSQRRVSSAVATGHERFRAAEIGTRR